MAIAEFNFGTLAYSWGDARLKDFQENIARVNEIAQRSDGFIWMVPEDAMEAAQFDPNGPLADRPNTASTLSVWESEAQLYEFVHKTLHARFLARGHEWYVPGDAGHLVIWTCDAGHRPSVAEGMEMWTRLQANGPTPEIFDGKELARRALAEEG